MREYAAVMGWRYGASIPEQTYSNFERDFKQLLSRPQNVVPLTAYLTDKSLHALLGRKFGSIGLAILFENGNTVCYEKKHLVCVMNPRKSDLRILKRFSEQGYLYPRLDLEGIQLFPGIGGHLEGPKVRCILCCSNYGGCSKKPTSEDLRS